MGVTREDPLMMHQPVDDYITREICDLHHQLTETKIEALKVSSAKLEERMDALEVKLEGMYTMQQNTFRLITYVAIIVSVMLIGVLLGRGIDFGLITG